MLIHKGERFQSGRGIGALFSGLFRTLKPLFSMGLSVGKKALTSETAKKLGSAAIDIGKTSLKNLAADILEGKDAGESLNKEMSAAKAKIASTIRGSGRKRKAIRTESSAERTLKDLFTNKKKSRFNLLE